MNSSRSLASDNPAVWLESVAETDADRLLISTPDEQSSYSYRDVADISGQFATYLGESGIVAGDRVAAQIDKSPEGFMLYLACIRMGAVFVPLNTAYSKAEMEYFIGDSQPQLVVCQPESIDQMAPIAKQFNVRTTHSLGAGGDGTFIENATKCRSDGFISFAGNSSDVAALLYTSGTTGRSKGAMITRRGLAHCANALSDAWHFTSDDVLLHVLPVFHGHGLFIAGNTVLAAGAQMIFMNRFDVDAVIRNLPKSTVIMGVPTIYTRLLKHAEFSQQICSNLRLAISGSAPITRETLEAFREKSGHSMLERYGLTEALIVTTNPYEGKRVLGSVGLASRDVDIRITDIETGDVLAEPNTVGKIEVRSPSLFKGYWRNAEKTAEDMRSDGYFVTGDLGKLDAEGYLYLAGREHDMIITGGYNVYPKEVETEINSLENVLESAVIGLPHPDFGEAVTAVVICDSESKPGEAEMLSKLFKRLAKYKCPKKILFVESFPRNAMGKIQKNVLRQQYEVLYEQPGELGE